MIPGSRHRPKWSRALAAIALLAQGPTAPAETVGDVARIKGQDASVVQGMGLVIGLAGTGDSGKDLALARPLAELLRNNGNPIAEYKELERTKSAAVVIVTATVPRAGGRTGDRFDAQVAVVGSASSLRGGRLFITPLRGPYPGDPVYAMAEGPLELEDAQSPTVARVRDGAQLIEDLPTGPVASTFDLIVAPPFAGWSSTAEIAIQIRENIASLFGHDPAVMSLGIARAIDDRTVRVTIPPMERAEPANFVSDVLATHIEPSRLGLPAQVICNARSGTILVTGDVQISPVAISHNGLEISTITPAPTGTPLAPLVERSRYAELATKGRPSELARLSDLIAALKQLDVPAQDQIAILQMLYKSGKLHARLIMD